MFSRYYQQELQNLRELAAEFARAHPTIAPMLSGPSADPDVERLLEGVAFLTGMLHEKIEDDFPEIIHGLLNIVFPHYIRPIPSVTLVAFSPKGGLQDTQTVAAGTLLASAPVEGTSCVFRTCFDVEAHPLKITAAELIRKTGEADVIRIACELTAINLSQWKPKGLSFCLGGSFTQAADLFLILTKYLRRIVIRPREGGGECVLPPGQLRPIGFDFKNALLPYPAQVFAGYRIIQEYFILPWKFLFAEITGWEKWANRGTGRQFDILFDLLPSPAPPPQVSENHFIPFTTPAVNLFTREDDSFVLDHRLERLRIRPPGETADHFQVYSIDRVQGISQGAVTRREYASLESFADPGEGRPTYQVIRARSPVRETAEVYLAFSYPPEAQEPVRETLIVTTTCTNGNLPERLQPGDICVPTSSSPELLSFRNLIAPTASVDPPLGENMAWRFLSHLALNYLNIADAGNLKDLLQLYVFPGSRDRAMVAANLKRIEGIQNLAVAPLDRLVRGIVMRGQSISMTASRDNYAGVGDLYLFGSIMDRLFGVYGSVNCFTQFTLKESITGETIVWPARLGEKPLI